MNTFTQRLALVLMMSSSVALADADGPRGRHASPADRMIETLALDASQAAELKALFEAHREQRGKRGRRHHEPDQAEIAAHCAKKAEMEAAIAAILTEAQQQQWAEQRAQRKQDKPRRRGPSCETAQPQL